ncbi:hypothetical protein BH11BAC1_BH11BAC1_00040 [soil metagenome]
MKLVYGLAFFCLLFSQTCFAEQTLEDSLKAMVKSAPEDSTKVNLLIDLGRKVYWSADPEQLLITGNQARALSAKINFKKGVGLAYKNIGRGYFIKAKYPDALDNYLKSLAVFDSIGEKWFVANMYNNIGGVYYDQGDEIDALDYFTKSLKLSEELNDTLRILSAINNIGSVYSNKKKTYNEALSNYLHALQLNDAMTDKDSNEIGTSAVNVGEMYFKKYEVDSTKNPSRLDSALFFLKRSLIAYGSTLDATYTLNYLGKVYKEKREFGKALEYHLRAVDIARKAEAKNDESIALLAMAQTYAAQGNNKMALKTFKEAEPLAIETEAKYTLKDIYQGLGDTYGKLSDLSNAFKYQNLLIGIKDEIYDLETDKKLGTIKFTRDLEQKESAINLLTKDQELKEKEISRQKIVRNSFMGGFAIVLLFAGVFFTQRNRISKEKKRSDELLLNILPEETAEELKATGTAKAKSFDLVSVLFTDFKNFTQASELLSPEDLVAEINHCYSEFDKIITRLGIEKIKTIGDAYMCAGGLPATNQTNPVDVVQAGLEMVAFIEKNKQERISKNQPFFELRCGVHTGPVVAGIVGIKKFAYDIWGDTVNTASRMESSGEIGKVNISGTTYELVKDKYECEYRGKVKAKNKGEIDMYFVSRSLGAG